MGGAASPLHDAGNNRSVERRSNLQVTCYGSLTTPAKPAGERENTTALTPPPGARSLCLLTNPLILLAPRAGLEPATKWLTAVAEAGAWAVPDLYWAIAALSPSQIFSGYLLIFVRLATGIFGKAALSGGSPIAACIPHPGPSI